MKESHDERLATHIGHESCGAARKGGVEALAEGSSRQGCESCGVKVLAPSIACIRTVSISGACGGNEARDART